MKARMQAASTVLLIALVLSFIPAAALPTSASAAQTCSDWAQFVADVTVPDGSLFDPSQAFTKTWRLRNIGTCTWSTSYTMVFDSGTQMGSTASVPFGTSVAPGGTIDLSVSMTAPNSAGHYIGYWKFKNASGTAFGIGYNANKDWWVEINVRGTPTTGVAYDFTANAGSATWSSGAGGLTFPGADGDAKGFALKLDKPNFESGVVASQPGLLVSPQQITNGFIQASYPAFTVQSGDRFQATVGCQAGATSCYVAYRLDYDINGFIRTFWTFREKFEGLTYNANLNLSPLAGQSVKFILYISAYGSPVGDRALWGNPVIARSGVVITPTVTGTPPTPTPTNTPGPVTVTVPPSYCDRAQFVRDVTIPDGTVMAPGSTFTKTWRLKNVGSCAWSTSYQLVYFSGDQMGAAASAAFPQNVAVGQTVDISINMTAPSTAGSYRGYWMFKNASGALFGIGPQGNKPWWVDIKVSGTGVTPGATTPAPTTNVAYDFATNACAGTWFSGAGQLPCPGNDGDAKGFVLKISNPKREDGVTDSRPGILTFPQNVQDGYIQGFFPAFRVQNGDRFRSIINCEGGATNCYVSFSLDYQTGSDPIKTIRPPFPFGERYEGKFFPADVDLSFLAGKDVKFILTVRAAGTATGDRALWVGPIIYRPGASAVLPDLTIGGVAITYPNASCFAPGETLGLRVSVTNSGQAAAGSFNVKSGDAQQTVSGLAVGETKSVFLSGRGTTVEVDSGGTVAESNEQNNSRTLDQVPVPTQPLPCTATPTTPVATTAVATTAVATTAVPTTAVPPTTAVATTPVTPAASAYQNAKYNFKFTLPSGAAIVSQTDNLGRVSLPIITGGTNLLEKYVQVNVEDNKSPCTISPAVDGAPTSTENVSINNIPFVKTTGQGVAAGNRYDWTSYATANNNSCISLAFILHSANPGNYSTPPPLFDSAKESAVIGTTISTYNKIS